MTLRECCRLFRDHLAPPCQECLALLKSDLFSDSYRELQTDRAEDEANHRDLDAERVGGRTRREGAL